MDNEGPEFIGKSRPLVQEVRRIEMVDRLITVLATWTGRLY